MEIFRLFGSVFIENEKANKSLQQTDQKAESVGKTLQNTIKAASKWGQEMGKQLTTVGTNISKKAGVPLAALTALMGGLAKTTADYGDRVAKQAQQIGLSVQSYQELEYAMGQNGVSTQEFEMSIGNLNQRIGMARRGNEQYRKTLEKLGFNLDALDKGAISTEESFNQIVAALADMDDGQMQAAIASDFFGTKVARRLIPAIRGGTEGIEELRQRAHDLGLVMDEEFTKRSELFGDTMDDLSRASGGLGRAVGKELLAPLINMGKWVTDIVSGVTGWIKENPKLVRQIIIWGGAIAGVLGVLVTLGTTLVITGKIIGALGAVFNILTSKPLLIIAAIGALYLAWENDWLGIRTAMENAWKVIEPILTTLWEWLGKAWDWAINIAGSAWAWLTETSWTDKIQEIKGWIAEAWTWTINTAGTVWDWLTETSWADKIEDIKDWLSSAWSWILNLGGTAWVWIDENLPWLADAIGWLWDKISAAWQWTITKAGDAWDWLKDSALMQWLDDLKQKITDSKAWQWTIDVGLPAIIEGGQAVIKAVVEAGGQMYDAIKKGLSTGDWADFWIIASDVWSKGVVIGITLSHLVSGISAVMSAIQSGLGLAAATGSALGIPGLIGALSIGIQLMEAQAEGSFTDFGWNMFLAVAAGIGAGILGGPGAGVLVFTIALNLKLGENIFGELSNQIQYLQYMLEHMSLWDAIRGRYPEEMLSYGEWLYEQQGGQEEQLSPPRTSSANPIWDIPSDELENYVSITRSVEDANERLIGSFDALLDAIYQAEGGAGARVPYGMTGFADAGNKFNNERNQALFEELSEGMVEGSDEYYRTAALVSAQHYWNTFQQQFPGIAGQTFDQLDPEMQQLFVLHMGRWFSPPDAHELNVNWVPNVLSALGHGDVANEFRAGSENLMDAWIEGVYDMASDAEAAAAYIAGIFADYLVGQSPPPEGPLSDIDEGGQRVMEAWVEGAEDGLKDGVPALTSGLEKVKGLFTSIWDKVPEEIKGPIEQAMTWITDLIGQAEEALFKLDDFQNELNALMGGDGSPEDEAQGFMAKLSAGLNDKMDQLDEPMARLTEAVYQAGGTLIEFGKAIASGNWLDAFLIILMETESFAKAMELLGAVLDPVIALFDAVLAPIINFLLKLWNGIIDALVSISIFGWQPFKGLKDKKIGLVGEGDKTELGQDKSSGGRQISEITGPTRDLLVDLLSPLANFGQIVAPIQDIRNILYERLPNYDAFGMEFAGAGAIGGDIVFESGAIVISSSGTSATELSRDMLDAIEREMARRINFGVRGRGGR